MRGSRFFIGGGPPGRPPEDFMDPGQLGFSLLLGNLLRDSAERGGGGLPPLPFGLRGEGDDADVDPDTALVRKVTKRTLEHKQCLGKIFETATDEDNDKLVLPVKKAMERVSMVAQELLIAMDGLESASNAFITAKTGKPQSEPEFRIHWAADRLAVVERVIDPDSQCSICMTEGPNVVIQRTCKGGKCTGHACGCDATMHLDCLYTYYWTSSEHGHKSFTKCPTCNAEFCMLDVRRVVPPSRPPPPPPPAKLPGGAAGRRKGPAPKKPRKPCPDRQGG